MLFKVDDRETDKVLWDAFDVLAYEKGFNYEKAHLHTGDVVCGNIVIERKEANDFIGSIQGRLSDQAAKMSLSFKHKYLIIEGNIFRTRSNIHHNSIMGMLTSLSVKYGIHIIPADNPKHFVYLCYSIVRRHMEDDTFNPDEHKVLQYKTDNSDILTAMLYQIPRLGWEKAQAIAKKCNYSLKNLVEKATKDKLMEINGIGEVMAERIMTFVNKV